MKRTRISVLLVIALLLQLYAPLTAGAADFTPNPQTEYAKRFIAACDGQTWFINEIERLLNAQQRTLDTITGAEDLVEIKSIAREAGSRTKIAVWSNDPDVDPVGACVGMNGARVNAIVEELRGEKIDIINWSDNPALLIENALSPAKVISVMADPDEKTAMVIVPDYQLSLAIGKEGQNARLAARLTGFKIDIKSETQARESGDFDFYEEEFEEEEFTEEGYDEEAYGEEDIIENYEELPICRFPVKKSR